MKCELGRGRWRGRDMVLEYWRNNDQDVPNGWKTSVYIYRKISKWNKINSKRATGRHVIVKLLKDKKEDIGHSKKKNDSLDTGVFNKMVTFQKTWNSEDGGMPYSKCWKKTLNRKVIIRKSTFANEGEDIPAGPTVEIHQPMQGICLLSLVREDSTCLGVAKPCVSTAEPACRREGSFCAAKPGTALESGPACCNTLKKWRNWDILR